MIGRFPGPRRGQMFAEIDFGQENSDRVIICYGCGGKFKLIHCLHMLAGINAFACRLCADAYYVFRRRARGASHQARVKRATPKDADMKAIAAIYLKAQYLSNNTGIPHHVDHIVPLLGCNNYGTHVVSGLHVAWNLRIIPWYANLKKSNHFEPEYQHAQPQPASVRQGTSLAPRLVRRRSKAD